MFFIMNFTKDVTISPADLSKDLKKIIRVKLIEQITGDCNEKYGYFIKVLKIGDIQNGYIMDGSGDIIFKMSYEAVLFRPFVNEVSDGIIEKILPLGGGIHVKVGPMLVFIPKENIPNTYIFEEKNNYYYNEKDDSDILKEGEKVRFKYKDIQFDQNDFKPVGTMADKYLGHILE